MLNLRDPKMVSHASQRTTRYTATALSDPMVTTIIDPGQDTSEFPIYDGSFFDSDGEFRSPISE